MHRATGKSITSAPNYDPIAAFYQQHWCNHFHHGLLQALDRLILDRLPAKAHVLDVCCGTGRVARHLARRGFTITGVDASPAMLEFAVRDVPEGTFVEADARELQLPRQHDAAICTFDSVSYFLTYEDLRSTFRGVFDALKPGGLFFFDLSLEDAYLGEWGQTCSVVEADHACFIRGTYDRGSKRGKTFITSFRLESEWTRSDVTFHARCWHPGQIEAALHDAGFATAEQHRSNSTDWLRDALGAGRCCFVARRED